MRRLPLLSVIALLCAAAFADKPTWFHIMTHDGDICRVKSAPLESVDSISFLRSDSADSLEYDMLRADLLNGDSICVEMCENMEYVFGDNVPVIYVATDSAVDEVSSKTEYLGAYFSMRGYGCTDDVDSVRVNVRGRGNSSWNEPKKPYRLKFDKKISLCGLKKAKNYVLIANHIDNTLMKNAVAFEIARLLGLPFTNHSIPVDVVFNGRYKGAYMLSEKVGINSGSVDIDEQKGIMWELDLNYDEEYKFKSPYFNIPVMLKDPDPADVELPDSVSVDDWFEGWQDDYNAMEQQVRLGNYHLVVDEEQAVNYVLANLIACNCELNWPKSVNLYKEGPDSLYKFGPVWDFDWAFNYTYAPDRPLLQPGYSDFPGASLLYRMIRQQRFRTLLEARWEHFKSELYPKLLAFIYEYAHRLRISAYRNGALWSATGNPATPNSSETFDVNVEKLLEWLDARIRAIDQNSNMLLY